jgi:uncharacterized protein (TIGR03086 family)
VTSIELHRRALDRATEVVTAVREEDLARPTPCAGWDLEALLAHMTGQNVGFATAVIDAEPGLVDFAPLPHGGWPASAEALTAALAAAREDRAVLLAEIHPNRRFPLRAVVGMHLLDTVVHTWDVATALGDAERPDDELVAAVLEQARLVPAGPARTAPGAAFAPALPAADLDPWAEALALLGRLA